MSGTTCTNVTNEASESPSGAFHNVFFVRYLLLGASCLYALLTLLGVYYSWSKQHDIKENSYLRMFRPVSVIALLLVGGTALTVSMLTRVLAIDGGKFAGLGVAVAQTNLVEIFLWVAVASIFVTTIIVLGIQGIFGSKQQQYGYADA